MLSWCKTWGSRRLPPCNCPSFQNSLSSDHILSLYHNMINTSFQVFHISFWLVARLQKKVREWEKQPPSLPSSSFQKACGCLSASVGVQTRWDENLIRASVLLSAGAEFVITNSSAGGHQQSLERYLLHSICGPHKGVWVTSWDERRLTQLQRASYWASSCSKVLEREQNSSGRKWSSLHQLWGCWSWKRALLLTSHRYSVLGHPRLRSASSGGTISSVSSTVLSRRLWGLLIQEWHLLLTYCIQNNPPVLFYLILKTSMHDPCSRTLLHTHYHRQNWALCVLCFFLYVCSSV